LSFKYLIPLCLLLAGPLFPQPRPVPQRGPQTPPQEEHGQLDSNETLFTVLAAINAAGYDAEINNAANSPVRKAVRDYIKALDLPIVDELRRFVRAHHQSDPGAELSQYISYALVVTGPPDFGPRYNSSTVPPDVDALYGLTPLIVQFYRDAKIHELFQKVEPQYDAEIAKLQKPIINAVLQVNAYLRNDTAGYLGRKFQIYVDLMGAPNQVQTRSYVDDYFVVVTPFTEPPIAQIRHAYLHYLLDILPLKYTATVMSRRGLGDYAHDRVPDQSRRGPPRQAAGASRPGSPRRLRHDAGDFRASSRVRKAGAVDAPVFPGDDRRDRPEERGTEARSHRIRPLALKPEGPPGDPRSGSAAAHRR
jgi:hypothetical protein